MKQVAHTLVYACLVALAACGSSNNNNTHTDAPKGSGSAIDAPLVTACDPITQTGCSTGERCTWVQVNQSTGYVGCQPNGTVPGGGACKFGSGFPATDNCEAGYACPGGICEALCDPNGSDSCGSAASCTTYDAFYQIGTSAAEAGMCSPNCNPVTDNSFGSAGDGIPPGSGLCGSGQGCYGSYGYMGSLPSFSCAAELNTNLVHRTACTMAENCGPTDEEGYSNGCAQGYAAGFLPTSGAMTIICVAYCEPQDCYMGNCGSNNLAQIGKAPHACAHTAIRVDPSYVLNENSPNNSCDYGWAYQTGSDIQDSPYNDTTGVCIDHSLYLLGGSGAGSQDAEPACNQLPGSGSDGLYGLTAADLGCISTTTATTLGDFGPSVDGKRRKRELPNGLVIDKPYFPALRARAR